MFNFFRRIKKLENRIERLESEIGYFYKGELPKILGGGIVTEDMDDSQWFIFGIFTRLKNIEKKVGLSRKNKNFKKEDFGKK